MKDITKYRGIIPAFYACYAPDGSISTEGVKALTQGVDADGVFHGRDGQCGAEPLEPMGGGVPGGLLQPQAVADGAAPAFLRLLL